MKILIANRGEIAVRIAHSIKSLHHMAVGILPYGHRNKLLSQVCSEVVYFNHDHTELSDTFLSVEHIIEIAVQNKINAIHPGYGFLSESPEFAKKCAENEIIFIGPSSDTLQLLGDKVESKKLAEECGVPTIKGFKIEDSDSDNDINAKASSISYPLIIKASYGGGGRGMRIVHSESELTAAILSARSEAERAFGNGALFIEKYIHPARHVEVQIIGDCHGSCIHLFERDCTLQRRHQKVIEIAPAERITRATRDRLYKDSIRIGTSSGLTNAATVEFLIDSEEKYYFIECNPRLQVEHTITEQITGIDIVKLQISSALGGELPTQESVVQKGYAVQARVCAESPESQFAPSTGRINQLILPPRVRIDNGYEIGEYITTDYDSLICKVICEGESYIEALSETCLALQGILISGVSTNIPFLLTLLDDPRILQNNIYTKLLEDISALQTSGHSEGIERKITSDISVFMANFISSTQRNYAESRILFMIHIPQLQFEDQIEIQAGFSSNQVSSTKLHAIINHMPSFTAYELTCMGYHVRLSTDLSETEKHPDASKIDSGTLRAPLPCNVIKIFVKEGDQVLKDQPLLQYESMKTEYTMLAPFNSKIATIDCRQGDRLNKEDVFLVLEQKYT